MSLIGPAWTANIIWYLRAGERCFTELITDVNGVSAKVLTARLRSLERQGVIERIVRRTSPPTTWYNLTEPGRDLAAALVQVVEAGQRLKQKPARSV